MWTWASVPPLDNLHCITIKHILDRTLRDMSSQRIGSGAPGDGEPEVVDKSAPAVSTRSPTDASVTRVETLASIGKEKKWEISFLFCPKFRRLLETLSSL